MTSQVARQIRDEILRGDLPPGSKLKLEDLRARLSVSLSPLREALSRLSAQGLVHAEDQKGYSVTPTSREDLSEVIRLRVELETLALREAIAQGDAEWEAEIVATSHLLQRVVRARTHRDVQAWETAHRRFHFALLAACNMPRLLRVIGNLHDLSDRYRRVFLQANPSDRDVPQEHQRIMEATLARESEVACALLRQHIVRTGENVSRALRST